MCQCGINAIFVFISIVVNNKAWAQDSNQTQNNLSAIFYPHSAFIGIMNTKKDIVCCAGTIISPSWVLTSNNCKLKIEQSKIVTTFVTSSIYNLEDIPKALLKLVEQWIEHPQFSVDNYSVANDVALLRLSSNFFINSDIRIISLASETVTNKTDFLAEGCLFFYWTVAKLIKINNVENNEWLYNRSSPAELTYKIIKVLSHDECVTELHNSAVLTHGQVCGVIKNNDHNDFNYEHTGGPLICNNIQFGFYTWQKRIGTTGLVIIFTKVDRYDRYITGIVPEVYFVKKVKQNMKRNKKGQNLFPLYQKGNSSRKSFNFNIFIVIMTAGRFSWF